MDAREWTWIDRAGWPPGPWDGEPDKAQWPDERTGLACLLKRNPRSGALCGYVGIPPGHPWHGQPYDQIKAWAVDREVSYSEPCEPGPEDRTICHVPAPGDPDPLWWVGFHCHQTWDIAPGDDAYEIAQGWPVLRMGDEVYRDVPFVRAVCAVLAAQAAAAAP